MSFLHRSTKKLDDKDKKSVNADNLDIYRDSRLTCGGRLSEEFIESLRKRDPKQSEQKKTAVEFNNQNCAVSDKSESRK